MKDESRKILLTNMGIFAAYTLMSYLISRPDGILYHAFFISAHVIIAFLIGIIRLVFVKNSSDGGAYILSSVLVLIIGFGTCMGIGRIIGALPLKL
jgi:VanZ family protein